jgi:hypothetical protein
MGLEPGNLAAVDVGTRPQIGKVVAERVSGRSISRYRVLVVGGVPGPPDPGVGAVMSMASM